MESVNSIKLEQFEGSVAWDMADNSTFFVSFSLPSHLNFSLISSSPHLCNVSKGSKISFTIFESRDVLLFGLNLKF